MRTNVKSVGLEQGMEKLSYYLGEMWPKCMDEIPNKISAIKSHISEDRVH